MVCNPGQLLYGGRYKIERQIGSGGMGIAYLAFNRHGKQVVLKTLRELILKSPNAQRFCNRFKDEALKLSLCRHPHIVTVENAFSEKLNFGKESIDVPFLAMEFIEGEDLGQIIDRSKALPEIKALNYILQIGEALEVVHEKGLLHRDIKPTNIMVRSNCEEAVLIDFGLAREFLADVTQNLTVAFTPGFAPPEQYSDKSKLGEFVDVYALAGTLYYLVTATMPPNAMDRMMHVPLTSARQLNPLLSEEMSVAITKGMTLNSNDRPQTIGDWLKLLPSTDLIELRQSAAPRIATMPKSSALIIQPSLDDLDYALARQQWEEADRLTALLLQKGAKKKQDEYLALGDIQRLPSHLLFSIDRMWTKYSQGHFGFRVQRQLWAHLEYKWGTIDYPEAQKFGEKNGWFQGKQWISYSQLQFGKKAPKAHLPSWRSGGKVVSWVAGRLGYFLNRWQ